MAVPIALGYHTGHWESRTPDAGRFAYETERTRGDSVLLVIVSDPCDGTHPKAPVGHDGTVSPIANDAAQIFPPDSSVPYRRGRVWSVFATL